jgi:predicted nuclease of predicted toxin-antitoxin system
VKFLCDENVDRPIVEALRRAGHTVTWIVELARGTDDDRVLSDANREGAILITEDTDFGTLVFRERQVSGGVLLLRLVGLTPQGYVQTVLAAVTDHGADMIGAFTVLAPGGYLRHRPLPDP